MSTNIPLSKASQRAEPEVQEWESIHHRVAMARVGMYNIATQEWMSVDVNHYELLWSLSQ